MVPSGEKSNIRGDSVCEPVELDGTSIDWVPPLSLKESPIGTSALSDEQIDRIKIIFMMLSRIFPSSDRSWFDTFSRDSNPEGEIIIWENIAKAMMSVEEISFASDAMKDEAFGLLLMRSGAPTADVLEKTSLRHFTNKTAKKLLDSYDLKPQPIRILRKS